MQHASLRQAPLAELSRVSWNDIGLIASIAAFGSLRQAAQALKINASTLVRHVDRLEDSLGAAIVDRLPQGFALNATGLAIAEIGRDMERHFLRLQALAGLDKQAKGEVKIAITEGLGAFWVSPKLPQFAVENPEIVIHLSSSMEIRNLLQNEADIAIQFRKPDNPDLIATKLCNLHVYPFASMAYLEKHGLPSLADGRQKHRIVIQESEQITNGVIHDFMRRHRLEEDVSFITNSSISHLYAIERGLGIGGLPTFAMAMGARLVPVDVDFHHSLDVWISYRREKRKIARISAVIDWLRQIFNPQRYPWFGPQFMHPSQIMEVLNQTLDRPDIFDSRVIKDFLASKGNLPAHEFRRKVGRPKKVSL
jgi:DNA-binding transcriptional LysR family regulator